MSPGVPLLQHPPHTPGRLPLHPLPGLPVAAERAGHGLMQPQAPQSCEHGGHTAALAAGSAPKAAVARPCPPARAAAGAALPGHPWVPRAGPTPRHGLSFSGGCSEERRGLSLR